MANPEILTGSIQVEGLDIPFIRKPIRHMYLKVRPGSGGITLSIPADMPDCDVMRFLMNHLDWLRQKLQPKAALNPSQIFLWGESLEIEQTPGKPRICQSDGKIVISTPFPDNADYTAKLIAAWRKQLVLSASSSLVDHWRQYFGLGEIKVCCRAMKSRWGSCMPAKNKITLNSQLSCAPPACLELVIAHELVHFFERGHGKKFYLRLARALPDWKERKNLLASFSS